MNFFGKPVAATLSLSALALSTSLAAPAGAADSVGSCAAMALAVAGTTVGNANTQRTPCVAANSAVVDKSVSLLLGAVSVRALQGRTNATAQQQQETATDLAAATVASVDVNLLGLDLVRATGIKAGTKTVHGANSCGSLQSFGASTLGAITVLGQTIPLDGTKPLTVQLPLGLGAVYVNQTVTTATSVMQRALYINLPGTFLDVIIAQASSGCASTGVQSMAIRDEKPSKALVRSVRHRIERLRDEPQQQSALTVEQTGH
jgi:hypothetical protein